MPWIIFFISSIVLAIAITRFKRFRQLWIMGVIGVLLTYMIDRTLLSLNAYSYDNAIFYLNGLPIFYLLSFFPGGILISYLYPNKKQYQLFYIVLIATVFLFLETIMRWLGCFHYANWDAVKSFFLNVVCFMAMFWIGQSLNVVGKETILRENQW